MDKISIIIPAFNVEKYIEKCVQSVLEQTYDNIEVIIINDGSTDRTGEICKMLKTVNSNKNIIVVDKENGGSASARNCGLKIASGELISFIDADDFVSSNFLENMYFYYKKYNADIVQCDYMTVYNRDKVIKDGLGKSTVKNTKDIFIDFCDRRTYVKTVVLWNKLFKKDLFSDLFIKEGKSIDDEYIILEIFKKTKILVDISHKLYFYYQSDNSQMRSDFTIRKLKDGLDLIDYQMPIIEEYVGSGYKGKYLYRVCRGLIDYKYFLKEIRNTDEQLNLRISRDIQKYFKMVLISKNVRLHEKVFLMIQYLAPKLIWRIKRGKI